MSRVRIVLRIGVIADTHSLYDVAIEEHFAGATEFLHAGDIGDRGVIERLNGIAPVVAVFGNVDEYEKSGFPLQVTIRRGGVKIAVRHVLYEKGNLRMRLKLGRIENSRLSVFSAIVTDLRTAQRSCPILAQLVRNGSRARYSGN